MTGVLSPYWTALILMLFFNILFDSNKQTKLKAREFHEEWPRNE